MFALVQAKLMPEVPPPIRVASRTVTAAPALAQAQPDAFVEMHPDLASSGGFGEGDLVRVVSRRGVAAARVRITETIRADTVFMPFHWGGSGSANLVTNPELDPVSKMPEFKVCAVRLEALT